MEIIVNVSSDRTIYLQKKNQINARKLLKKNNKLQKENLNIYNLFLNIYF